MPDFDEQQREADNAAAARARESRRESARERDFRRLSPERQAEARGNEAEARMLKAIDNAVDARIKRMVLQSGQGIRVTGGNGTWTIATDLSALSLSGNAVVNCDTSPPTITLTFNLK